MRVFHDMLETAREGWPVTLSKSESSSGGGPGCRSRFRGHGIHPGGNGRHDGRRWRCVWGRAEELEKSVGEHQHLMSGQGQIQCQVKDRGQVSREGGRGLHWISQWSQRFRNKRGLNNPRALAAQRTMATAVRAAPRGERGGAQRGVEQAGDGSGQDGACRQPFGAGWQRRGREAAAGGQWDRGCADSGCCFVFCLFQSMGRIRACLKDTKE